MRHEQSEEFEETWSDHLKTKDLQRAYRKKWREQENGVAKSCPGGPEKDLGKQCSWKQSKINDELVHAFEGNGFQHSKQFIVGLYNRVMIQTECPNTFRGTLQTMQYWGKHDVAWLARYALQATASPRPSAAIGGGTSNEQTSSEWDTDVTDMTNMREMREMREMRDITKS